MTKITSVDCKRTSWEMNEFWVAMFSIGWRSYFVAHSMKSSSIREGNAALHPCTELALSPAHPHARAVIARLSRQVREGVRRQPVDVSATG